MRNNYEPPNPFTFGNTEPLKREQKAERQEFKAEELKKELFQEGRENETG